MTGLSQHQLAPSFRLEAPVSFSYKIKGSLLEMTVDLSAQLFAREL